MSVEEIIQGDAGYYKLLWEEVDGQRQTLLHRTENYEEILERKDRIIKDLLKVIHIPALAWDDHHHAIIKKAQEEVT